MFRSLLLVFASATLLQAGDPALDAKCRDIAKKLSASPRLSEAMIKPYQQAADEVRAYFFRDYDIVRLTDDNRAFFCATVLKKESNEDVRLGAIRWLGQLRTSKTAAVTLGNLLGDKNMTIRAAAIQAIGGHRDPTLGPKLAKLLTDESPEIRRAALIGIGRLGDRKQVTAVQAAYKKYAKNDESDAPFGEALAALGENEQSLKIAQLAIRSRDHATRLCAVRALEYNPSMKVIPIFMENLVLELRRTISLDKNKPEWDAIYVTMVSELQRRTGKGIGHDAATWINWWEGVRTQYGAPAPVFDRDLVDGWMDQYRKMGPSKIRE
jgi:hypothetical protein